MRRSHRRLSGAAALLAVLTACSDVAPTNPFDPETPAAQQHKGRVVGSLFLPAGFRADPLVGATVELYRFDAPAEVAYDTTLEVIADADPPRGDLLLESLLPGAYRVVVNVRGFSATAPAVDVAIGGTVDLGEIPLVPLQDAVAEGVAERGGAAVSDHGGILVEAVGTPYTALTATDGRFRLPMVAGTFTLSFRAAGYRPEERVDVAVAAGGVTVLPEPVVLQSEPGQLVGTAALAAGVVDRDALGELAVEIRPAGTPGAEALVADVRLDAEAPLARFSASLAAGRWDVSLSVGGFYPELRTIEVPVGAVADLGHVVLSPLPRTARIEGVAQIQGAADHSEIAVELDGGTERTTTNGEGRFSLGVPARPRPYTLRIRKAGYGVETVEVPALGPEAHHVIAEPVVLVGQPASLQGIVQIDERFDARALMPQVEVRLSPIVDGAPGEPRVETPSVNGIFGFEGLAAGEYVLEVALDGFFSGFRAPSLGVGEGANVGIIRLSPNQAQATVAGAARVRCPVEPCDHGGIRVETVGAPFVAFTNEAGQYRLTVVEGEYALRFVRLGYESARRGPLRVDAGQVQDDVEDVLLRPLPGRVLGRLSLPDGFDGPGLFARSTVEIFRPEAVPPADEPGVPAHRAIISPDGLFTADDVALGAWVLRVRVPGFALEQHRLEVPPGGQVDLGVLELGIVRPATVRGRVQLEDEAAHAGARISVRGHPFSAITGADGDFQVQVLAGQPQALLVNRDGFEEVELAIAPLEAGEQRALVDPILVPFLRARVTGVVLRPLADGRLVPARGVSVSVVGAEEAPGVGVTDAEGRYTVGDLRGGPYTLQLDLPQHARTEKAVRLVAGETLAVEPLALDLLRGSIIGSATRVDAPELPGVTVLATRLPDGLDLGGAVRAVANSAPGGDFTLPELPVGRWSVVAVAEGHRAVGPAEVEVGADAATRWDAALPARVHRLAAPTWVAGPEVEVTFTADADLAFYHLWIDEAEPDEPVWTPLPADGRVRVPIAEEGAHRLFARLATAAEVEGGDPVLRATSPILEVGVVVDRTAPVAPAPIVGDGRGFVTSRDGDVVVQAICLDALAPAAALDLTVAVDDAIVYEGPWRPAVALNLGAAEGLKTLTATCTDAAGNVAEAPPVAVIHDYTPPTVRTFCLEDGCDPPREVLINRLDVVVGLAVEDALAGGVGVALSEAAADCAEAAYLHPGEGLVDVRLRPGEGARRMHLCARDRAGNTTPAAIASANTVRVDTAPPPAPALSGLAPSTRTADLNLALEARPDDPGLRLQIVGDVQPVDRLVDGAPVPVRLVGADGPKLILATYTDAAGNVSAATRLLTTLDTTAPADGRVVIAGGSPTVRVATVSVTIEETAADLMFVAADAACAGGPPACGDPRYVPFAPATSVTLSDGRGQKTVCWRLCDQAGNASRPGNAQLVREVSGSRPRPVLMELAPARIALSDDPVDIELRGEGLPADAEARVGALLLPCVPPAGAGADCRVVDDGHAGCADHCTVTLPAGLTRRAGSHFVRLVTPDPVVDGLGESVETLALDVIAPLPRITQISPRGIQRPLAAPFLPDDEPPIRITVQGCRFADNAQFILGDNVAAPCDGCAFEAVPPADRAVERPRQCPDGEERITLEVPIAGLPTAIEPLELVVRNPAPGGGDAVTPFGIAPSPAPCVDPCVDALTATRGEAVTGVQQTWTASTTAALGAVRWLGGTAAARGDGLRVEAGASGGLLPLPWGPRDPFTEELTVEDGLGVGARVVTASVGEGARRGDGVFDRLAAARLADARASAFRLVELDGDGILDLVMIDPAREALVSFLGSGDGTFEPAGEISAPDADLGLELADLDLDGWLDAVVVSGGPAPTVWIFPGRPGGRFGFPVVTDPAAAWPQRGNGIGAVAVGDMDGDRLPDIVTTASGNLGIVTALGSGTLVPRQAVLAADEVGGRDLALGDIDGDGRLDAVVLSNSIMVFRGLGDGRLALIKTLLDNQFRAEAHRIVLADVNLDGALDLVSLGQLGEAVHVRLNPGNGDFPQQKVGTGLERSVDRHRNRHLTIADVDGDAWPDVVVVADAAGGGLQQGDGVRWLKGRGDGAFTPQPALGGVGREVAVADVDADGGQDIVALGEEGLSVYLADPVDPAKAGGALSIGDTVRQPGSLAVTSREGGGAWIALKSWLQAEDPDSTRQVSLIEIDGAGEVISRGLRATDSPGGEVIFADIDEDDVPDLVATGLRELFWWPGPAYDGAAQRIAFGARGSLRTLAAGDLDADGDTDLVVFQGGPTNAVAGNRYFLRKNADGSWRTDFYRGGDVLLPVIITDADEDPLQEVVYFFDRDNPPGVELKTQGFLANGQLDIIHTRLVDPRRCAGLGVAHLGGGPAPDLYWRGTEARNCTAGNANRMVVLLDAGVGPVDDEVRPPFGGALAQTGGLPLSVADFNGDGLVDVATVAPDNRVNLHLDTGSEGAIPALGGAMGIPIPANTTQMRPFDVNQDGAPDVITVDSDGLVQIWWGLAEQPWALALRGAAAGLTEETAIAVRQPQQYLDHLAVKVAVEAERAFTLRLEAPGGQSVVLDPAQPDPDRPGSLHYRVADVPGLAAMVDRWQPAGRWTLTITPGAGAGAITVRDFTVLTRGRFTRRPE